MSKTRCRENDKGQSKKNKELPYECEKCGLRAKKDKHLCKPEKL